MRIQSITEVNTQQFTNPHVMQTAGYASTGKEAPLMSFKDHLRAQVQESKPVATPQNDDGYAANLVIGYCLPQWVTPLAVTVSPELRNRVRAKDPLSEL